MAQQHLLRHLRLSSAGHRPAVQGGADRQHPVRLGDGRRREGQRPEDRLRLRRHQALCRQCRARARPTRRRCSRAMRARSIRGSTRYWRLNLRVITRRKAGMPVHVLLNRGPARPTRTSRGRAEWGRMAPSNNDALNKRFGADDLALPADAPELHRQLAARGVVRSFTADPVPYDLLRTSLRTSAVRADEERSPATRHHHRR